MENVILVASIILAVLYGIFFRSTKGGNVGSFMKTMPLLLLALYVYLHGGHWLLVAALVFSAMGDLALSRLGDRAFLIGLVSFAIAHVMYIGLFVPHIEGVNFWALGALALLVGSTFIWLLPYTKTLTFPVAIYIAIISVMAFMALSSSLPSMVMLGVVAFVLSDLMLSIRIFRSGEDTHVSNLLNIGVWIFYYGGQLMIALGMIA